MIIHMFRCPICSQTLHTEGSSWHCANRHSFDRARSGYVNLLNTKHHLAATIGDSKEMLQHRRIFLETGAYTPLVQATLKMIQAVPRINQNKLAILDAGCGEGYYLGQLAKQIANADFIGTDIAKIGVEMAAKKHSSCQYIVADTNQSLPFLDQTVDITLNMFAPRNMPEFARILKSHGHLLIIIPQPNHLQEFRQTFNLLAIEPNKEAAIVFQAATYFTLKQRQDIRFELTLDGASLEHLILMTPNARFARTLNLSENIPQAQATFSLLLFQKDT
jgi:23S rRNA (guanine745-N1)-methyltransferase